MIKNSLFCAFLLVLTNTAFAQDNSRQKAWQLHNRIAGVPPQAATLDQMETMIRNNQIEQAAHVAMQNPLFYGLTLKNWFKSWSNAEENNRVDLNDYVATAVGMIRDNIPFDSVLYGDHLYIFENVANIPDFSPSNNDHYRAAEQQGVNLVTSLARTSQSAQTGISDTAGVLTTRASGEAFLSAGTNRRLTRFTFMNYLCRDFEAVMDFNTPDIYVRRDVERDPGGDSRTYRTNCVGCHAGQDALGGAFSYFDYQNDRVIHRPGTVQNKINFNNLFEDGHVVEDARWYNLWHQGANSNLGFRGPQEGYGARELGQLLARSEAFSKCMATRAFELVCLNSPSGGVEMNAINNLASRFEENNNYNMKNLIAGAAALCVGSM
jgi:hypothetical protein